MPISNAPTIGEWTDSYNRFNTQFTYEAEIPVDNFIGFNWYYFCNE
jgi:hypothetical protein